MEFSVIVIIDPPTANDAVHHRDVQFFLNWVEALDYVRGVAQGDDPGRVTIISVTN